MLHTRACSEVIPAAFEQCWPCGAAGTAAGRAMPQTVGVAQGCAPASQFDQFSCLELAGGSRVQRPPEERLCSKLKPQGLQQTDSFEIRSDERQVKALGPVCMEVTCHAGMLPDVLKTGILDHKR